MINSQKLENDLVPIARVNTTAELPLECYNGFIVEVINSFDNKDNYFLKYKAESNTKDDLDLTKSDGFWEEIAKPFERFNPKETSLPHMITVAREADRTEFTFIVSKMKYKSRSAGTFEDNPSMFVDSSPITEVNYYKNRLFFMTRAGTVITSRADDISNLFPNTATTISLIDPIDVTANSNQRVPIYGSAVVNNGLVMFGESEQYSLTTAGDLLTSETANVTKISNYTFNPVSNPIYIGTNIGFISKGLTRFYEMTNVYDRGPVDINERSQQIQAQFGQGFNMPASSREQSMVIVYKKYRAHTNKGRSTDMYLYRFRQENSQESSQTAWVKWKVNKPVAYVSLPQDKMFVFVHTEEDKTDTYVMDSSSLDGSVPNFTDGYTDNTDGASFETKIVFPTMYPRGKESYDITSNVTIHRVKMSTAFIGTYNLTIDREGYDTYELLVEQTPSDEYKADNPTLRGEHVETIPIYTRNKT